MSMSPETTTTRMSCVSGTLLIALQRAWPPMPRMVRSARIISGRSSRARASALWPSETISLWKPWRWRILAISCATGASSSTTRITATSRFEADADLLAQVSEGGAGQRTDGVGDGVGHGRHPRGERVLPYVDSHRKDDSYRTGDHVRLRARPARPVQGQEHQEAPGDEEKDVRHGRHEAGQQRVAGNLPVLHDARDGFQHGVRLLRIGLAGKEPDQHHHRSRHEHEQRDRDGFRNGNDANFPF